MPADTQRKEPELSGGHVTIVSEPQKTTNEEPHVFSDTFGCNWNGAHGRVNNGRLCLESVRNFIAGMAELELQYAATTRKLANILCVPPTESEGVASVIHAVRLEALNRATHCEQLAQALQHEVIANTANSTITNHECVLSKIKSDGDSMTRNMDTSIEKYKQAASHHDSSCRVALRSCLVAQNNEMVVPQERSRFNQQALQLCVAAGASQSEFQKSTEVANAAIEQHNKQCQIMLVAMEDMDKKRIHCLKDTITKMCIYITAYLRNREYDLTAVPEAANKLDTIVEIASMGSKTHVRRELPPKLPSLTWPQIATPDGKSFVDCIRGSEDPLSGPKGAGQTVWNWLEDFGVTKSKITYQPTEDKLGNHPTLTWSQMESLIDGSVQWNKWSQPHPNLEAAVAPRLAKYEKFCDSLWKGDFVEIFDSLGPDAGPRISSEFANSLDRYLFCRALTKPIIESNLCLASMNSLHALTKVSIELLNLAASGQDFWTGRFIMVASQLFCAKGNSQEDPQTPDLSWEWPSNKKAAISMSEIRNGEELLTWTLHRGIYQHPLWNRVTFWDAALVLTLSEEKQRAMIKLIWAARGHDSPSEKHFEEDDMVFRQKNPCCKILHSFSKCMVAFGIVEDNAANLIERVYRRYGLPGPEDSM